jgi:hypothetical protein
MVLVPFCDSVMLHYTTFSPRIQELFQNKEGAHHADVPGGVPDFIGFYVSATARLRLSDDS